jgi:hypothetical protein
MTAPADLNANELAECFTGRPYISWSAISTYRTCPLKHYFRYIAGLPEESVSASLVFSQNLHAALEHHYRESPLRRSATGPQHAPGRLLPRLGGA